MPKLEKTALFILKNHGTYSFFKHIPNDAVVVYLLTAVENQEYSLEKLPAIAFHPLRTASCQETTIAEDPNLNLPQKQTSSE